MIGLRQEIVGPWRIAVLMEAVDLIAWYLHDTGRTVE